MSLGYFNETGNEYVITELKPPRVLMNYMWNERFFSGVNQFGTGDGAYCGYCARYLDPQDRGRAYLINGGKRFLYLNDLTAGEVWCPGWYPAETSVENYSCRVGMGYSVISSARRGLAASLRGFVHESLPAEVWTLTLRNETDSPKRVKVFPAVEFHLAGYPEYCGFQAFSKCEYDAKHSMVFAHNSSTEIPHPFYSGYLAASVPAEGFDSSRAAFVGLYGSDRLPLRVREGKCSNSIGVTEQFVGVLCLDVPLAPRAEYSFSYLVGMADTPDYAADCAERVFIREGVEQAFRRVAERGEALSASCKVETPDQRVNRFVNHWLKQQIRLCAMAGRASMKGFRDQLQDAWGAAAFDPDFARAKIVEVFQNIYRDGSCPRGFSPLDPHIYSDGPIWAGLAVPGYVRETGDYSILHEATQCIDGGRFTISEQLVRVLRHTAQDTGPDGLVLAREGDWNDSLNFLCRKGRGESVWTSIALVKALSDTAEMFEAGSLETAAVLALRADAERLKRVVNERGWDGDWYLAGINDLGEGVGSASEEEGKIYLNSQSWAVYASVAEGGRERRCLDSAERYLTSDYGPLTLYPPYTKRNDNIGRLTAFQPGIWENGTPYCHGGAFLVVAQCMASRAEAAYETLSRILPDSVQNPCVRSGEEPYALTNMYYGPAHPRAGQTMFGWVTGTAGWIYRAVTEYMFGFRPGYGWVEIRPALPADWGEARMERRLRGATYRLTIKTGRGKQHMTVDGAPVSGSRIPLFEAGTHEIEICYREE